MGICHILQYGMIQAEVYRHIWIMDILHNYDVCCWELFQIVISLMLKTFLAVNFPDLITFFFQFLWPF